MHALPGFDEYLLGYRDRSLILPVEHAQRIVPGNNGMFLPMIVSRGRIVGIWRRPGGPGNAGPDVQPDHFTPASSVERRGFDRAASSYARFAAADPHS
ncbi:MAG: crosslink repair DNA glycosylase YcaQ family protein [Galbitalea sp.]